MKRGSKLAIKKLKLITPKEGSPFYSVTVVENVNNPSKPFAVKWETVFYEGYIFDTSKELEEADFSLGENKIKYHFDNIANKDKSVIRVLDFDFEHRTMWDGQEQIMENGKPKYKAVFYITRFDLGDGRYVSEDTQIKNLKAQVEKLKEDNAKIRAENASLRRKATKNDKLLKEKSETLRNTQKELEIVTKPKYKTTDYKNLDNISFDDM